MLPPSTSIGSVQLNVANFSSTVTFYRDVLGFRVALEKDRRVFFSSDGQYPFQIIIKQQGGPSPGRTAGLYHFAILYPSRVNLAGALRHLREARWPIEGASDHGVSEAIYLEDPEGNGIEIYADRDRAQWPRLNDELAMTTRPLDVEGLLGQPAGPWAGAPPGTRIGHIHLRVTDLKRAEAFYSTVLGFEVMVRSYPGALFLAAGGYHHHIGLNTWAGTNLRPADPQGLGLGAFSIRLPDRDALGAVLRRFRDAGGRIGGAIDHGRDVSLAVRDPDGIVVNLEAGTPGGAEWQEMPLTVDDILSPA